MPLQRVRTRRSALGLAAGVTGAVGAAAAVTGTATGATGAPGATTRTPTVGVGPRRRGGTVRAVFPGGGAKETLDPHAELQFVDMARHKAMFDKLVDLDSDLRPVPRLARDWSHNADATRWRFTLRPARFHDGGQLGPEDVLFSIARMLDPHAADHMAAVALADVDLKRCRAIGARTVEIALKRPNAELPSLFGGTGTAIVRRGWRDPSKPVGTGPFRFGSFEPGRSFSARRFDDHWAGAPYPDEVRILSAETEARAGALQAGEVDYAHEMTPTFARSLKGDTDIRIVAAPGSSAAAVALKTDRPPFDDPRATLAMKLLADRRRLVDVVLDGRGLLGNDMFGKGFRYYPKDVPQRERDLSEARRLLRRTGALNKRLTFYTSTVADGFVETAHLFARQAAEAGLRIDVVTGPPETYYGDQLTKGTLGSHRSGAMTIPAYLTERMLSDAPKNATAWHRPSFDRDFAAARATTDGERRAARYAALQRTVRDEGGLLLWGHPDWLNGVAARLHGVTEAPPNTLDWARFDTVWLDG